MDRQDGRFNDLIDRQGAWVGLRWEEREERRGNEGKHWVVRLYSTYTAANTNQQISDDDSKHLSLLLG